MTGAGFHFQLGCGPDAPVSCRLGNLVDTRLLIQANSGGGKSWCVRRFLEQTHGHIQQLVVDPEGECAGGRAVTHRPRGGAQAMHDLATRGRVGEDMFERTAEELASLPRDRPESDEDLDKELS